MTRFVDDALALPGGLLLCLCLSAKYLAPRLRPTLGKAIYEVARRQRKAVTALQRRLRNPVLDQLAKVTALTVSVEFYLLALPPMVWLAGQSGMLASMALCQCMAVSTYMTCALKDIISCPRPYMFSDGQRHNQPHNNQQQKQKLQSGRDRHQSSPPTIVTATAVAGASASVPSGVVTTTTTTTGRDGEAAADRDTGRDRDTALGGTSPDLQSSASPAEVLPVKTARTGRSSKTGEAASSSTCSPTGPSGPAAPVENLEDQYRGEIEFGPPSMHTWCALVLPAYAAAVAQQLGAISATQCTAVFLGSICWAAWVAFTRLYLGVHAHVDLALGALGGASVLGLWRKIGLAQLAAVGAHVPAGAHLLTAPEAAATTVVSEEEAVGVGAQGAAGELAWASWFGFGVGRNALGVAAVGLLYLTALATYPVPASHTTSYEYAVIFLGAAFGGLIGTNADYSLVLPLLQRPAAAFGAGGDAHLALSGDLQVARGGAGGAGGGVEGPTVAAVLAAAAPAVLRHPVGVMLLGFVVVAVVKLVSKAVLSELLPKLLRLAPLRLRLLWQPPVHPEGCTAPALAVVAAAAAAEEEKAPGGCCAGVAEPPVKRSGSHAGVLMKTATLPYDVDFIRKFINYGLTVYAVNEFRHVATVLLQRQLEM